MFVNIQAKHGSIATTTVLLILTAMGFVTKSTLALESLTTVGSVAGPGAVYECGCEDISEDYATATATNWMIVGFAVETIRRARVALTNTPATTTLLRSSLMPRYVNLERVQVAPIPMLATTTLPSSKTMDRATIHAWLWGSHGVEL